MNLNRITIKDIRPYLSQYGIHATDEEIELILNDVKENPELLTNPQKRSAYLQALPDSLRNKLQRVISLLPF